MIIDRNIRVHVEEVFHTRSVKVYVFQDIDEDRFSVLSVNGDLHTWTAYDRGIFHEGIKPTYHLEHKVVLELVTALTKEGYKPADLGKVEGLYEAQSKHLTDLQRIVFNGGTRNESTI